MVRRRPNDADTGRALISSRPSSRCHTIRLLPRSLELRFIPPHHFSTCKAAPSGRLLPFSRHALPERPQPGACENPPVRRAGSHDHVRCHIPCHHSPRSDDRAMAHRHVRLDLRPMPDPCNSTPPRVEPRGVIVQRLTFAIRAVNSANCGTKVTCDQGPHADAKAASKPLCSTGRVDQCLPIHHHSHLSDTCLPI